MALLVRQRLAIGSEDAYAGVGVERAIRAQARPSISRLVTSVGLGIALSEPSWAIDIRSAGHPVRADCFVLGIGRMPGFGDTLTGDCQVVTDRQPRPELPVPAPMLIAYVHTECLPGGKATVMLKP